MTLSHLNDAQWHDLKGKLKQRYGQLTDDDLVFVEGKIEELVGRLQLKLGVSQEDLDSTIADLAASGEGTLNQAKAKFVDVSDQVRAKAGEVVDDLRERAAIIGEEAKAQGAAAYQEAQMRARGLWEDGEEYVRQNPRHSIVVAAAAGFVLGLIVLRR